MQILAALLLLCLSSCQSGPRAERTPGRVQRIAAFDGTQIEFEVAGTGEPTLVFVHGWCGNRRHWDGQVRTFSPRGRTVAVDLPGHGGSGAARKEWSLKQLGADLAAVLEALDLEQAVLIGHSMGGLVSLEAAVLAPQRVAKVIAVDTLHDVSFHVPEHNLQQAIAAWEQDFAGTSREFSTQLFGKTATPALRQRIQRDIISAKPRVAIALLQEFMHYDRAAALGAARVPVVCINSDQRPTNVAANRAVDPDYGVIILPNTGHFLMLEQPALFDKGLLSVLPPSAPAVSEAGL